MEILKGRQFEPPRLLIYGQEGIGKTTFGASAPSPIFLATEDGQGQVDCDRFPVSKSINDVIECLDVIQNGKHDYQTLVVDSIDGLERLIYAQICANQSPPVDSIELVPYGKGPGLAVPGWCWFLDQLSLIRAKRGMAIILLGHSRVEKFSAPDSDSYDRYQLRVNRFGSQLLNEWADAVLFAYKAFGVAKEDKGFNKVRTRAIAIGGAGGNRMLRTEGSATCVAKNRYTMPEVLPLDWAQVAPYLAAQNPTPSVGRKV